MNVDFSEIERVERHLLYKRFSSPTPDDKLYNNFVNYTKKAKDNKINEKQIKEMIEEAKSIFKTQLENGIDLSMSKEIRHFLLEFNHRMLTYGLGSMPSSFNILEPFFNFNSKIFLFELFEEEFHLFSIFDFIDFITSKNFNFTLEQVSKSIKNDFIYSFDLIDDFEKITFLTGEKKEFGFLGISLIKRNNELTVFVLGGEKIEGNININIDKGELSKVKSYIEPDPDLEFGIVKLGNNLDYWKTLLAFRVDLESNIINSRYLMKNFGNQYEIYTDDFELFLSSIKDRNEAKSLYIKSIENLEPYKPIFDIAYKCIFLKEYFRTNSSFIAIEEHPTELINEKLYPNILNKKNGYSIKYFKKNRSVFVIDKNDSIVNKVEIISESLKIENK
jgi:hypothetical protein